MKLALLWSMTVCVCATFTSVRCDFVLLVNLINYINPTGLCAECQTTLDQVTTARRLVPVCCDELPYKSGNCDNTGDARCDTRFRWTIRRFVASLETRPVSVANAPRPPYYFTDCGLSPSTCPFSEASATFSQGPAAFLGVAENPLTVLSTTTSWTGRIQFFIEALDSGPPNIIDSLLVNLYSLQLGGDFTEETMFTGFHNIATMTMSFRVECSPGFCGRDCTTTPTNNPLVAECQADGSVTCVDSKRDPSAKSLCHQCLYNNRDISTGCSTCLRDNYDPNTNCTICLPGWDIRRRCIVCLLGLTGPNCTLDADATIRGAADADAIIRAGITGGAQGSLFIAIVGTAGLLLYLFDYIHTECKKKLNTNTTGATEQTPTNDPEAIQLQPNVLDEVNTEANHTHQDTDHTPQYETVDNSVSPTTDTDLYENKGLSLTRPDYNYILD